MYLERIILFISLSGLSMNGYCLYRPWPAINGEATEYAFRDTGIVNGNQLGLFGNFQKKYSPAGMAMEPYCMSGDKSNGYLLAGDFYSPSENNSVARTTSLTHIDEKGCITWARSMIAGEAQVIQAIISTSDSGYLISAFPYQSQQSNYPKDLIVFKLDKSGNKVWAHSFSNGTTVNNYFSAICETPGQGFALEIGSFPIAGNPSSVFVITIDQLGRFVWGRQLAVENNSFYNVGGIVEKNKFLYATGSIYEGVPPYDVIRSFLVQIDELSGQTTWTKQNDPRMSPLSFTDIHKYKSGLLINSYSENLLNNFIFCDDKGNVSESAVVNNPYGSLNGKESIIVNPDNGLYFHQSSGTSVTDHRDIIMRADSNLQIMWQFDVSEQDLDFTGWYQLAPAPELGVAGIGSGLLPDGLNALAFIKMDSAGSGCNSGKADLQIIANHSALTPLLWNINSSFSMNVTDVPISLDEIFIESRLICPNYITACDKLKLDGPAVVCKLSDTVRYTIHNDPFCSEPVTWSYTGQSATVLDSNEAYMSFRFTEPGNFLLRVERTGCNKVIDSVVVSVGNDAARLLPGDSVLCAGQPMKLDAGAGYTGYLWQDGTERQTITVTDTGEYHVKLTSKNGCIRTDTVLIGSIKLPPSFFLPPDTVICAGDAWLLYPVPLFKNYYWSNGETGDSMLVKSAGVYSLEVVDEFGCTGNDTIRVETKKCPYGIYFPNAFTPNKDGQNDVFRPVILGHPLEYHFDIYNRWGQQVFETSDPKKGWDGMLKRKDQGSEAFIWVCIFQFEGEKKTVKKGSFLLLR